jgi:protein-disulfide isomerase
MKLPAFALAVLLPALSVRAATPTATKDKTMGSPTAPIVLELYSDFMCPHCKHLHEDILPAIVLDFVKTGKAYLIFREYPLNIPQHVYSRPAASFATAAARVGKYQQVSDALFKTQEQWGLSGRLWDPVASALTPDEQKRVQVLANDPSVLAEVQRDVDMGQKMQINQTPTIIVTYKGKSQPWSFFDDYTLFKGYLDGLLKK